MEENLKDKIFANLQIAALDPQRATQFLDLLWGHNIQLDTSNATSAIAWDSKRINAMIGKRVKLSVSLEVEE